VAPSDNLWYTTIDNLISSIDGIQNVTIDALNNTITIESTPNGPLENQIITIDILIEYEISCES
jgi:hypothetical protein